MWIKTRSESMSGVYVADIMDEKVHFYESGLAQVTKDVGEALCERYEQIEPHSND